MGPDDYWMEIVAHAACGWIRFTWVKEGHRALFPDEEICPVCRERAERQSCVDGLSFTPAPGCVAVFYEERV